MVPYNGIKHQTKKLFDNVSNINRWHHKKRHIFDQHVYTKLLCSESVKKKLFVFISIQKICVCFYYLILINLSKVSCSLIQLNLLIAIMYNTCILVQWLYQQL